MFGDIRHARCRYCCVLLNAHRNDLLRHSRSAKHATNVAFGRPCSDNELAHEAIARSLMQIKRKNERLEQKKSRFSKLQIRGYFSTGVAEVESIHCVYNGMYEVAFSHYITAILIFFKSRRKKIVGMK